MKKIIAVILCLTLMAGLSGCGKADRYYKAGKYEESLALYEEQGNTEYVNKCRFMLLSQYIMQKGDQTQSGTYVLYDSYLSNTGGISLFVDPQIPGQLQVLFYIEENTGEMLDMNLFLNVDDPVSTFVLSLAHTTADGETITDCQGTVDISTYNDDTALTFAKVQQNLSSATANTSTQTLSASMQTALSNYFCLGVESLHEFLTIIDMGTTTAHLGFAQWEPAY